MADKNLIGRSGKSFTMPIEWGKVREFARAIRDGNPVYFDPEAARRECGGIPIPPTFLMTSAFWQDPKSTPNPGFDINRSLHGEQEFEFIRPIYVGDVLSGITSITEIAECEGGRGGMMTLATLETRYSNQEGELVAITRMVTIETGRRIKDN